MRAAARELEIDSALIYNWRRVHRVQCSQSELERQHLWTVRKVLIETVDGTMFVRWIPPRTRFCIPTTDAS